MVGQGANPQYLLQAGGPGNLISSVEQSAPTRTLAQRRSVRYNKGFSQGTSKNRLACKGSVGVDKKHGSYARFLARKTGGVLRKEKMRNVMQRKASIHQPRNRTGTAVSCRSALYTTTTQELDINAYGQSVDNCTTVHDNHCCTRRIPQLVMGENCLLSTSYANRWNSKNRTVTGACGNNTQNASSTRCRCCSQV